MRFLLIPLLFAAQSAIAAPEFTPACPAPLEFTARKTELMTELRQTRNRATGIYLTQHLVALYTTAPNRRAQDMLNDGITLRRQLKFDAATEALDALIAYCPDFAEGYHQRAMLRRTQGDLEGALSDLDSVLDHAPDHLGAMARRAQVLAAMGRYRDGEKARNEVLQLNPWMPERFLELQIPGTPL